MTEITERIATIDWDALGQQMHRQGYAVLPQLLSHHTCEHLRELYHASNLYRKTVVMERYRFGQGEYKYFRYPLPEGLQQLRSQLYARLVPIANAWFRALGLGPDFPASHPELLRQCHANQQPMATVLVLKYGKGGYNTLHQDLYGAVYFPLQLVLFLSEPEQEYTGGEFVLVQQTPRAQSKAMVLKPKKGDGLIFTTNFMPVKGSKGYYRTSMKHGVSEVHGGERYTLGIIFHDATT